MTGLIQDSEVLKEKQRLSDLFTAIPQKKRQLVDGLIDEAAFLRVAMQNSKEILKADGLSVTTVNASQRFIKSHPIAKTYIEYVRQYNTLINALCGYLPEQQVKTASRLKALINDDG